MSSPLPPGHLACALALTDPILRVRQRGKVCGSLVTSFQPFPACSLNPSHPPPGSSSHCLTHLYLCLQSVNVENNSLSQNSQINLPPPFLLLFYIFYERNQPSPLFHKQNSTQSYSLPPPHLAFPQPHGKEIGTRGLGQPHLWPHRESGKGPRLLLDTQVFQLRPPTPGWAWPPSSIAVFI